MPACSSGSLVLVATLREMDRLTYPVLFLALCILGLALPASANGPYARFALEPVVVNVTPCTNFRVDVSILSLAGPMEAFSLEISWTNYMELVGYDFGDHGWVMEERFRDGQMLVIYAAGEPWSDDETWLTVTFHCTAEGTSTIRVYGFVDPIGAEKVFLDPVEGAVHQYPRFVGGDIQSVNKLAVLAPYLALVGLVAAVSAVYMVKRRKP